MIPWQIYADYLEDRGYDTRLFRHVEPKEEIEIGIGFGGYLQIIGRGDIGNYGDGWGAGLGNYDGDGYGSCGYHNGDGWSKDDTLANTSRFSRR